MRTSLFTCSLALFCAFASAQQSSTSGQSRQDGVDQRGDHVMGFSHDTTTHHFHLLKDGGEIVVTAKDPKDTAGVEQIRMHLSHIVGMFSNGNFTGRRSHDWELGVYAENPQNCSAQAVS